MTARETLRAELLTSGLSGEVPLAEVETVINRLELTKTTAEQFYGWEDLPLDEAMARVTERYVAQYDDPSAWVFSGWLKLTDAGKGVATALKDKVD